MSCSVVLPRHLTHVRALSTSSNERRYSVAVLEWKSNGNVQDRARMAVRRLFLLSSCICQLAGEMLPQRIAVDQK